MRNPLIMLKVLGLVSIMTASLVLGCIISDVYENQPVHSLILITGSLG